MTDADEILRRVTTYLERSRAQGADAKTLEEFIKELADAHHECLQKYWKIWESARDGMALADNETGTILDVNQTIEALTGLKREELIGRQQTIMHPPGTEEEYRTAFENHGRDPGLIQSTLEGNQLEMYNHQTGLKTPVEISSSTLSLNGRPAIVGIFRDLTDHLRLQKELTASKNRYRELFHQSVVPHYTTDEHGRILEVNEAFLDLLGYTREELRTLRASDLYLDPKQRETFVDEIREAGFVRDHQVELRRKNGESLVCLLSTSLRVNDHETREYQGSIRDITEQVKSQARLRYRAEHDHVTGLWKIHLFEERLEAAIDDAKAEGKRYAALFLNPQGLKYVNDTAGIEAGNRFLRIVSEVVVNALKEKGRDPFVARLNNDTLGIILENASITQGRDIGEWLLKQLNQQQLPTYGAPFGISMSIGVTEISGHEDETREAVFKQGDDACKIASRRGGNQVVPYDLSDPQIAWAHDKPAIAAEGLLALKEGRLSLVRQGIYSRGRLVLEELLLRMEPKPGERTIPTSDLILALEEQGKIKRYCLN